MLPPDTMRMVKMAAQLQALAYIVQAVANGTLQADAIQWRRASETLGEVQDWLAVQQEHNV